jgi:methionine biosynthesis protein MetW
MPPSAGRQTREPDGPAEAGSYDFPVDLTNLGTTGALLARHIPAGASVLDVGCASGNLGAALIADRGCSVTGVDVNAEAVAAAQAKGIDAHVLDLQTTSLTELVGEHRFDRIILADVLEHLADPAPVLAEVRGLLTDQGRVLVSLPNVSHVDIALSLLADRWQYRNAGLLDRTHLRFFTLGTFTELAGACGFQIDATERIDLPPLGTEVLDYGRDLVDRTSAETVADIAERSNPHATVYQFVLVLRPGESTAAPAPPRPSSDAEVVSGRLDVIVRTMPSRLPLLTEALYSLAALTWPSVHAIVVIHHADAAYRALVGRLLQRFDGLLDVELLVADRPASRRGYPLNVGLDAARGEFVAFCDDDDVLYPAFADVLIGALQTNPSAPLAYGAAVQAEGRAGEHGCVVSSKQVLLRPFNRAELFSGNYIPINTFVVRRRDLVAADIRFDESLEYFEDWELLCELARSSNFLFVEQPVSEFRVLQDGRNSLSSETTAEWRALEDQLRTRRLLRPLRMTVGEAVHLSTALSQSQHRAVEAEHRAAELQATAARLERELHLVYASRVQRMAERLRRSGLAAPIRKVADRVWPRR